jgi:hypothetical protein
MLTSGGSKECLDTPQYHRELHTNGKGLRQTNAPTFLVDETRTLLTHLRSEVRHEQKSLVGHEHTVAEELNNKAQWRSFFACRRCF